MKRRKTKTPKKEMNPKIDKSRLLSKERCLRNQSSIDKRNVMLMMWNLLNIMKKMMKIKNLLVMSLESKRFTNQKETRNRFSLE